MRLLCLEDWDWDWDCDWDWDWDCDQAVFRRGACVDAGSSRPKPGCEDRVVVACWTSQQWYFGCRVKGIEPRRICFKFIDFPSPYRQRRGHAWRSSSPRMGPCWQKIGAMS